MRTIEGARSACDRAPSRDRTGALVVAVRDEDGAFSTNPPPDARIEGGQVLIAIGTPDELLAVEALAKDRSIR